MREVLTILIFFNSFSLTLTLTLPLNRRFFSGVFCTLMSPFRLIFKVSDAIEEEKPLL